MTIATETTQPCANCGAPMEVKATPTACAACGQIMVLDTTDGSILAVDIDDDLAITRTTRRATGNGTWVRGRLSGHRFCALVFPEHAENREWEIGDSKISKLWIQRLSDKKAVFNWDRGADIPAADRMVQAIVDFLGAGLSDYVYAQ
jgi:hypothetical protein